MKNIYEFNRGKTSIRTKVICTLKELRYFFVWSIWSRKYRFPQNSIMKEFIDCFEPLTWD